MLASIVYVGLSARTFALDDWGGAKVQLQFAPDETIKTVVSAGAGCDDAKLLVPRRRCEKHLHPAR